MLNINFIRIKKFTSLLVTINFVLLLNLLYACTKDCLPIDCKNGGVAIECGCQCPEGFTGPDCSQKKCPTPCYNGGECIDGKCKCKDGWGGPDCAVAVDKCAGHNPCLNGGICKDGTCICPPGCSGPLCETCVETETIHHGDLVQLCYDMTSPTSSSDFSGMGVDVEVSARLRIENGNELWADIRSTLSQVNFSVFAPYTSGKLERSVKLWTAPNGKKIVGFNKATEAVSKYIDWDNGIDERNCPGTFIQQFNVNAETEGIDLGECTFNYSYLTVKFDYLTVKMLPQ